MFVYDRCYEWRWQNCYKALRVIGNLNGHDLFRLEGRNLSSLIHLFPWPVFSCSWITDFSCDMWRQLQQSLPRHEDNAVNQLQANVIDIFIVEKLILISKVKSIWKQQLIFAEIGDKLLYADKWVLLKWVCVACVEWYWDCIDEVIWLIYLMAIDLLLLYFCLSTLQSTKSGKECMHSPGSHFVDGSHNIFFEFCIGV